MQSRLLLARRSCAALLALVPLALPARAASVAGDEDALYRAYFLEHEGGDAEAALELYRRAAADASLDASLRAKAQRFADGLAEDLAARDLARLMPADAIVYAELSQPGEHLASLLRQLGLLNEDGAASEGFGISPALVSGALGLRGAALAITQIDPNGGPPSGVLVLHPGELEIVRGIAETSLAASAARVEPIAGFPTWGVEGGALVSLGSRLIVAGNDPRAIDGVLRRLKGERSASLADSDELREALAGRGDDLLHVCLNAEPVRPMLEAMLRQHAAQDPQAAMMLSLFDPSSVVAVAGRLAVDGDGFAFDLSLHLDEGHKNLVFDLLRMPALERRTLELVPEGAAFFLAAALNEPMPRPARVAADEERRSVSMMDFGREIFGNLVDLAVFALPPAHGSSSGGPIPDVAAVLRSNDPARSHALWKLVLGLGSQAATNHGIEPELVEIDGVRAEVYGMGVVPIFLAQVDDALVMSPSRGALERTFAALRHGRSVANDKAFEHALAGIDASSTLAALVHPGRCAAIARNYIPPRELREAEPFLQLFGDMVVGFGVEHSDTHLALRARVQNVPDVSGFVTQMIEQRRGAAHPVAGVQVVRSSAAVPAPAPATIGSGGLRERFDRQACEERQREAALGTGALLIASLEGDATGLNNFAWELLTEERYGQAYDELALRASELSNEASGYRSWYLLDTLALACFRTGNPARAVELQEQAVKLAGNDTGAEDAAAALKRYREALAGARSR